MIQDNVPPRLQAVEHRAFTLDAFQEFYPRPAALDLYARATEALARDGIESAEQVKLTFFMRPDEALQVSAAGSDEQGRLKAIWIGHWPPRDREVPLLLAIFATKPTLKMLGYIP